MTVEKLVCARCSCAHIVCFNLADNKRISNIFIFFIRSAKTRVYSGNWLVILAQRPVKERNVLKKIELSYVF